MSENKTQKTESSVTDFLNSIPDEGKRSDSFALLELMRAASGLEPRMWGPAIIGFGDLHYKYESGRQGDIFQVGFSPRKQNLTLYTQCGFPRFHKLLAALGKYKTGKGCLHIHKLSDINMDILKEIITLASLPQ